MRGRPWTLPLAACVALLAACATTRSKQNLLDDTLRAYASAVRWGDLAQAQAFLDPKLREQRAPSALDLARFKQVRVTAYEEQPRTPVGDDEVSQVVEIGLVNVNTQTARSIVDRQLWRYDEKDKRWWLTSGLPDITHSQ
ncbi:MAG TPA: hypothetical protein VGC30_01435 [Dokdonella sp.]